MAEKEPDWVTEEREELKKEQKRIEDDPSRMDDFNTANWKQKTEDPGLLDPPP